MVKVQGISSRTTRRVEPILPIGTLTTQPDRGAGSGAAQFAKAIGIAREMKVQTELTNMKTQQTDEVTKVLKRMSDISLEAGKLPSSDMQSFHDEQMEQLFTDIETIENPVVRNGVKQEAERKAIAFSAQLTSAQMTKSQQEQSFAFADQADQISDNFAVSGNWVTAEDDMASLFALIDTEEGRTIQHGRAGIVKRELANQIYSGMFAGQIAEAERMDAEGSPEFGATVAAIHTKLKEDNVRKSLNPATYASLQSKANNLLAVKSEKETLAGVNFFKSLLKRVNDFGVRDPNATLEALSNAAINAGGTATQISTRQSKGAQEVMESFLRDGEYTTSDELIAAAMGLNKHDVIQQSDVDVKAIIEQELKTRAARYETEKSQWKGRIDDGVGRDNWQASIEGTEAYLDVIMGNTRTVHGSVDKNGKVSLDNEKDIVWDLYKDAFATTSNNFDDPVTNAQYHSILTVMDKYKIKNDDITAAQAKFKTWEDRNTVIDQAVAEVVNNYKTILPMNLPKEISAGLTSWLNEDPNRHPIGVELGKRGVYSDYLKEQADFLFTDNQFNEHINFIREIKGGSLPVATKMTGLSQKASPATPQELVSTLALHSPREMSQEMGQFFTNNSQALGQFQPTYASLSEKLGGVYKLQAKELEKPMNALISGVRNVVSDGRVRKDDPFTPDEIRDLAPELSYLYLKWQMSTGVANTIITGDTIEAATPTIIAELQANHKRTRVVVDGVGSFNKEMLRSDLSERELDLFSEDVAQDAAFQEQSQDDILEAFDIYGFASYESEIEQFSRGEVGTAMRAAKSIHSGLDAVTSKAFSTIYKGEKILLVPLVDQHEADMGFLAFNFEGDTFKRAYGDGIVSTSLAALRGTDTLEIGVLQSQFRIEMEGKADPRPMPHSDINNMPEADQWIYLEAAFKQSTGREPKSREEILEWASGGTDKE